MSEHTPTPQDLAKTSAHEDGRDTGRVTPGALTDIGGTPDKTVTPGAITDGGSEPDRNAL